MNYEQLKTFLTIVSTRSYSKTGRILFVSQPAVSARVKTLEKIVGFQLLKQVEGEVILTKEGEVFYSYAEQAIEILDNGLESINQLHNKYEGDINIASTLTFANYYLTEIAEKFYRLYPNIVLNIQTGHSQNILDMVMGHVVSFGITREIFHDDVEKVLLLNDELIYAVNSEHSLAKLTEINLGEIDQLDEPLILLDRGSIDWYLIKNAFSQFKHEPNIIMKTDNVKIIKNMVKKGIGNAIMPRSGIGDELGTGNLRAIQIISDNELNRPFQLIKLKSKQLNQREQLFHHFLVEELERINDATIKEVK